MRPHHCVGTSFYDYRLLGGMRRAANTTYFAMVSALCHNNAYRNLLILTNLFVSSPLPRVPAPQLHSQVQQQRGGQLCVLFCLVLAHKVSHLWRQHEILRVRIFMIPQLSPILLLCSSACLLRRRRLLPATQSRWWPVLRFVLFRFGHE